MENGFEESLLRKFSISSVSIFIILHSIIAKSRSTYLQELGASRHFSNVILRIQVELLKFQLASREYLLLPILVQAPSRIPPPPEQPARIAQNVVASHDCRGHMPPMNPRPSHVPRGLMLYELLALGSARLL